MKNNMMAEDTNDASVSVMLLKLQQKGIDVIWQNI